MKGPTALGTILVNSSINSNLKPRHLSINLKGSLLNYLDKTCIYYLITHTHTHTHTHIYIYIYYYAAMCPAGLQGAVHSRQVHQLTQGTDVGCGLPTLFNVTDITKSLAEPHFKATRWVIGELLKVNTANCQACPLKYEIFDKYNDSAKKTKKNNRVWVNKINNTSLLLNKRKKQRKRKKKQTIRVKVRSEKVFLYLGRASIKIFVYRTRSPFNIC